MRGPYLLGVYGVKRSNFTISVTQEKYPMMMLSETQSVKYTQDPFEIIYYLWYNSFDQKDFKVTINVLTGGGADLYINTFDIYDET